MRTKKPPEEVVEPRRRRWMHDFTYPDDIIPLSLIDCVGIGGDASKNSLHASTLPEPCSARIAEARS